MGRETNGSGVMNGPPSGRNQGLKQLARLGRVWMAGRAARNRFDTVSSSRSWRLASTYQRKIDRSIGFECHTASYQLLRVFSTYTCMDYYCTNKSKIPRSSGGTVDPCCQTMKKSRVGWDRRSKRCDAMGRDGRRQLLDTVDRTWHHVSCTVMNTVETILHRWDSDGPAQPAIAKLVCLLMQDDPRTCQPALVKLHLLLTLLLECRCALACMLHILLPFSFFLNYNKVVHANV